MKLDQFLDRLGLARWDLYRQSEQQGRIGTWIYTLETDEFWWSDQVYRLYGVPKSSKLTKDFCFSLVLPEDVPLVKKAFQRGLDKGKYHVIFRIILRGKVRWLEERGKVSRKKGAACSYLLGAVRDVTVLHEMRRSVNQKSAGFEAINRYLAETTNSTNPESIVISAQKTIGKIMDIAAIGIFYKQNGKIIHLLPHGKSFSGFPLLKREEDYTAYQTIQSGRVTICPVESYRDEAARKELVGRRVRSVVAFPIMERKRVVGALSIGLCGKDEPSGLEYEFGRTICGYLSTQLKNAMLYRELKRELAERHRAESDMDTIFAESVDFLMILDKNCRIARVNPALASKLGYSAEEVLGRRVMDFIHPEDLTYAQYICKNIAEFGVVRGFRNRFLCKNGEAAYVENNITYSADTQMVIVVARDLTNQKEIETRNLELQRSFMQEKLKSEFFSSLSHEFKTPLNIVLSSLDLIKLKLTKDNAAVYEREYKKFFSYACQNCYRLLRLTTNLVDASRIGNQFYRPSFQIRRLSSIVGEVVSSAQPYASARGISLRFVHPERADGPIALDVDKIDRIVLNLLSNAIKNTPKGGEIQVSISEQEQAFMVSVKDNGVGLPQSTLPYIFDKFRVNEDGFARSSDGSGLGLFIVKSLVEMHDGTICVESSQGQGSCFRFTISKHLTAEQQADYSVTGNVDFQKEARLSRVKLELSNID